jgi:hypothetical protein
MCVVTIEEPNGATLFLHHCGSLPECGFPVKRHIPRTAGKAKRDNVEIAKDIRILDKAVISNIGLAAPENRPASPRQMDVSTPVNEGRNATIRVLKRWIILPPHVWLMTVPPVRQNGKKGTGYKST